MLDNLRRRLSPGTVLGTIALFVALGGGYATAFSGSGSLQKQGAANCPTSFGDFRQLTGFGALQVKFDTTTDPDQFQVRVRNSTSHQLRITYHPWKAQPSSGQVAQPAFTANSSDVQSTPFIISETGPTVADFHILKGVAGGEQVRQQVTGQVHVQVSPGFCDTVRVLALNTQG